MHFIQLNQTLFILPRFRNKYIELIFIMLVGTDGGLKCWRKPTCLTWWMITKQDKYIQLIHSCLLAPMFAILWSKVWEETGIPRGNPPARLGDHLTNTHSQLYSVWLRDIGIPSSCACYTIPLLQSVLPLYPEDILFLCIKVTSAVQACHIC